MEEGGEERGKRRKGEDIFLFFIFWEERKHGRRIALGKRDGPKEGLKKRCLRKNAG